MAESMTPEQLEFSRTRAIHDADLLGGGAVYLPSGVLNVTADQVGEIADDYRLEQRMDFQNTPEGKVLKEHRDTLLDFGWHLGGALGHTMDGRRLRSIPTIIKYLQNNNIDVDIDRLGVEDLDGYVDSYIDVQNDSEQYVGQLWNDIHWGLRIGSKSHIGAPLIQVEHDLIDNPHIRFGNTVKVVRTDGTQESDWRVNGIRGDGRLEVVSSEDGEMIYKDIPSALLLEWNPKPEEETVA